MTPEDFEELPTPFPPTGGVWRGYVACSREEALQQYRRVFGEPTRACQVRTTKQFYFQSEKEARSDVFRDFETGEQIVMEISAPPPAPDKLRLN